MPNYIQQLQSPRYPFLREEAERMADRLREEVLIFDGVARWEMTGDVIPEDCAEFAKHLGLLIDLDKCREARDAEFAGRAAT